MRLYLGIDLNPSRCNDDASFLSSSDVVTTDCSSVRRCHIGISSRSFPSNIRNFFQGSNHGWATITCETLPRRLLRSVNKRLSCVATSHWTNWISSVGKCRPKRAVPSLIYLRSRTELLCRHRSSRMEGWHAYPTFLPFQTSRLHLRLPSKSL